MPIDPDAAALALLQQQMQQAVAQGLMMKQAQQSPIKPPQQQPTQEPTPSQAGGPGAIQKMLAALGMGGNAGNQFQAPQPQTLGFQQPMPMQLPPTDPLGQQKQEPLPPDPMGMSGT